MGPTGPAGSANINGTTNRIIKFTSATTGGNSLLFDNGTNLGLGTTTPGFPMQIVGTNGSRNLDITNSNVNGDGIWATNTAAAGANGGAGVVGISSQSGALGAGVWGENPNTDGIGVVGVASGVGNSALVGGAGGAFSGNVTGVYARSATAGVGQAVYTDQFGAVVRVNYWNGTQFKINGAGSVSTIARDPTDPAGERWVTLFAPEAPEILFEDYGQAELVDGFAHVEIDPIFAGNVIIDERHPLRVFIQLEDNEFTRGVVVKNKTPTGFDVVEMDGGASTMPFTWHIVCNRADEVLPNGRISRNADQRFQIVRDILQTTSAPPRMGSPTGSPPTTAPDGSLPASTSPATGKPTLLSVPAAANGDPGLTWLRGLLPLVSRPR